MSDDQVNIAVLVLTLLFAWVMFPAALRQNDDAEFGRVVRESFP